MVSPAGAGLAVDVFAPAKVNLYLQVVGRRPDGYHLLDSLVVFAGVGDTITIRPSATLSLTIDGPMAPLLTGTPDNVVLKAARGLAEASGVAPAAAITLTKRLPVAAGIGGGSADGAAALRALCRFWNIAPDETLLSRIGLSLGADLPVCLAGRPTQMAGIGEILSPAVALPPAWLVLVNPRVGVSTPAVFKARHGDFSAPAPLVETLRDVYDLAAALKRRRNDLAEPAIGLAPVIGDVLAAIGAEADCLLSRMSGSGATCFGLFADEGSAEAAAARLTAAHPNWWVAPAPLVER
ncbi:4-(cytidine 5'-diphospho)-2-C-methyl-D-erythritol kinase [Telmatospirillum sp.]|uniref:4-(cytidine 5'-diphospho)-2-C-methyl-D-erythritol kinase n=1 Tax=Telmatospirillum sp. TaxID=2079197 RepID=UPI002847E11A|nr:4-(cytidine 5'-diphospho)-2-C-methyl-D-erythritol kinase [Telmatospirillum sp.]MDR3435976.1 4-(cytidine 5'-diphospho)-2-C-methyl-D-erythritol kinase [Telmatospirillum sp.]